MKDLSDPKWIVVKGMLFFVLGVIAVVLLWTSQPTLRTAALIGIAVWAFCRFYYFAFYVIEGYVDPNYKFRGLFSLVSYLVRGEKSH